MAVAYIIILLAVLGYYANALGFFVGGDDVFMIVGGPRTWQEVFWQFVRTDQYRPIPHTILGQYVHLPHSTSIYHLITLIAMSAVGYLLFRYLKKLGVASLIAIVMSFVYLTSHIFFYIAYSVAGMGDLIYLLFFFGCLLNYPKRPQLSLVMFVGAMLSKEIFAVIPLILTAENWVRRDRNSERYLKWYYLLTGLFLAVKFGLYRPIEAAYTYHWSLPLLLANIKHFGLWLINYRHGWQMGMPLPASGWYIAAAIVMAISFAAAGLMLWKENRKRLWFFFVFVIAGLVPFLLLSRVLVFYLDVSYIGVVGAVGLGLSYLLKKSRLLGAGLVSIILISSLIVSVNIRKQWLTYSFVAVAEETASNFRDQVVLTNEWEQKKVLCLIETRGDAAWAVANGRAIELMTTPAPEVITREDGEILPICREKQAVVYKNVWRGWERVE